jgi:nucleotide-binding universal stress UspA family protein
MKMPSYSRILLCYNATREGRMALRKGATLAQELRAETHLLAVWGHPVWAEGYADNVVDTSAQERQTVGEILHEGVANLASLGVFAIGHLAIGDPLEHIPLFADQLEVDLIVLGHHRKGRLARWWTRNTDSLLLDRVRCSVLVVIDGV